MSANYKSEESTHGETVYKVTGLPDPPSSADIRDYRTVRLEALRRDPSAFTSTYEREAAFDEETWRGRLTGSGKATFVARARRSDSLPSAIRVDGADEAEGKEAVGCMTVIAAHNLGTGQIPGGVAPERDYFVFGMWVHPGHRRRGVGKMVLKDGLAWIVKDAAARLGQEAAVRVWVAVTAANFGAKKIYEEVGFIKVPTVEKEEAGEIWMSLCIERGCHVVA
ncbi:hypothetical protein L226DRAFT_493143 [Lentinus tigrinus ALCF2SS1-7]|uniref:N-acetyltransferase domain-containing protein n=1 Tax=Lentinus tigrinus ALCF2SS1-6 TaxID=1328759 RepID=A0A5C2RKQ9_9APHY|nr:hypothetical protein L227DRAFT_582175 [Lentinus tigrinus ALCF2SS1-6]RPD70384.1 hypothetical protein L226DRAFT_493143 [Lentinus tigrinus ALCF2SS1-7]